MKSIILFSFCLFLILQNGLKAQEICNNGIDDNGNGLIDLNDTAACSCHGINGGVISAPSLIPNPSFEDTMCCPSTYSQMNCASGWIQASYATSDYMNTCDYIFPAIAPSGLLPFPNGNGIVGAIVCQDYKEYVGSCLTQPMLAGQSYTIQMNIASTPISPYGDTCGGGIIYYSPIDITIFGSISCANMPFNGYDCPPPTDWPVLGSTTYAPVGTWGTITITFTPTVNINAIIIGSPCIIPADYNVSGTGCYQYFYYDNLLLNNTSFFSPLTLNTNGSSCQNNVVLQSHSDTTGGVWQWYQNGIALVGSTDSLLYVSANSLGTGLFTVMYSLGNDCDLIADSVFTNPPVVNITSFTNINCNGGNNGSITATASGGTGALTYLWNTVPPLNTSVINNLSAGTYVVTVTDLTGCISTDSVTLTQGQNVNVNNIQTLCDGETYMINTHVYNVAGTYEDTLMTVSGCDSIVTTVLNYNPQYIKNNPKVICSGQSYQINSHSYSSTGTYHDTLSTSSGCDSVIVTQLVVNQSYTVDNPHTLCGTETYSFNSHQYNLSGQYYDTLNSVTGCDSIVRTLIISNPLPQLTFAHPGDLCIDGPELPLSFATPPGGTYSGTGVSNNIFYPSQALEGIHPVTYSYIDPVTNCRNSIDERITVYPLPEVQLTINPKIAFLADNSIAYVDFTSGGANWTWNFGDSTFSGEKHGYHHYNDTGYYDISLVVIDDHGCKNSSSDNVYIGLEFAFNVPNAFTPNGDGKNETFNGVGVGIKEYEMTIFDRWGNSIFHTNDLYKPWEGDNSPGGAYVYKIDLQDITGKSYEFVGHVSILR